ncbi:TetR family transcriptional regulator [Gordonia sp. SID5947]|uniref:TetR/AcrR family transcriptional regulator n=1 Tax=Gordonia sp. SID5947 TaxID=2690315 RepID=UPI001368EBA2|nr:TetR/AcrR family transcriptional regulator [Gordonia sp. SID5947]MYR08167.1 TetR family transcriptional regulator [Gordonia sp. SID5947]
MSRPYRGRPSHERSAERRERLVDAGVELVGTGGVNAMTMRAVCRVAGLSQKFFYESFADTDALLHEVYRTTLRRAGGIIDEAATDSTDADSRRRVGVDTAARLVAEDPRVCRILFVEPIADQRLRAYVRESIVELISPELSPSARRKRVSVQAKMQYATLFGSIISLFIEWSEGNLGDDREVFVDHVTDVLEASPT